jgi:hypothetical protein
MIVLTLDADDKGRPVIERFLAASAPRTAALEALGMTPHAPIGVRALIDTGASCSNVQKSVLERLGLEPVGEELVHTASTEGTPKEVAAYAVQIFFAGVSGGQFDADLRVVAADDFSGLGVEMLLGRDVLGRCLIFFNGPEGRFTLAFSPAAAPS